VEDFAQLAARLRALPPSYLRPRRITESVCICPVQAAEGARFNESQQQLEAVLLDASGGRALLSHPFQSRGRTGFDALLAVLAGRGASVRFVSGHVASTGEGLTIRPILVVLDDGSRRIGIQPCVNAAAVSDDAGEKSVASEQNAAQPIRWLPVGQLRFELSELLPECRAGAPRAATLDRPSSGASNGLRRLATWSRLAEMLTAARLTPLGSRPRFAPRAGTLLLARVATDT
jgi:hypothetical protein